MKIFKKLIPFAALTSVVTIATPLIASCGPQYAASWSWDGNPEHKKEFIPSCPQAPEQEIEQQGADATLVEIYYKDISKNPLIFAQDLVNAFSKYSGDHTQTSYVEVIAKSFDVDVSSNDEAPLFRSSFDVVWSASINFFGPGPAYHLKQDIVKSRFSLRNMPITFEEANLQHKNGWVRGDNKWSIEMPKISHKQGSDLELELLNESTTYTSEFFNGEGSDIASFFTVFMNFVFADFAPYHLQNIKFK